MINDALTHRSAGRLTVVQSSLDAMWYVVENHAGERELVEGPVATKPEAEAKARMLREYGVPLR